MTVATVETLHEGDIFADETLAAGVLPAAYVDAVVHVPRGAWPLPMPGYYARDAEAIAAYAEQARSAEGFAAWLADHLARDEAA